jgi:hypothetical protein
MKAGLEAIIRSKRNSALTRLETRVALADHENLAATTHDLAVAMPGLGGLERRKNLHDTKPLAGGMQSAAV